MTTNQDNCKKKLSLTTLIVIGLILGLLTGLFFGERVGGLKLIGTVYVRLLQMTILPYITLSLIYGFGSLTYPRARLLVKRAGAVFVSFWILGIAIVWLMTLTFPDRQSATFFSPGMINPKQDISLIDLFVPANPFNALANSAIPAIVLFSILFGLALISVPKKEEFLSTLSIMTKTLQKVTSFVVKLTPIGVFAMMASAAGTLNLEDVIRLQVYFVTYIGTCLFLGFVVFPVAMSTFTTFSYFQVMRASRDAMITAFTTGNLFVVLPLLIENTERLFKEAFPEKEEASFYTEILIPVTFNFPNMGKLTALLFIFFGAWFIGKPITMSDYPSTFAVGFPVFFGGIDLAVPYMLQFKNLPSELFNLYMVSGIINGRFATLLACIELLCFTLIAVSSILGCLRIKLTKIFMLSAGILLSGILIMGSMRILLEHTVPTADEQSNFIKQMSIKSHVDFTILDHTIDIAAEEPKVIKEAEESIKEKQSFFNRFFNSSDTEDSNVSERNKLKVGVYKDNMPWSYLNTNNELSGFDVEMAHLLADHLSSTLEFHIITPGQSIQKLDEGEIDLIMSAVPITTTNVVDYTFSETYMQLNIAMLSPRDPDIASLFSSVENFKKDTEASLAYIADTPFLPNIRALFPGKRINSYESISDFFDNHTNPKEALITSAEAGSAISLIESEYKVIIPANNPVYNIAYPINPADKDFKVFIDQWIEVEKKSQEFKNAYNYWILGQARQSIEPRWSIIHNVLQWTD